MPAAAVASTWWRFPLGLVLLEIVVYLSQDMYLPALPRVQASFGVGQAAAQLSIAAWSLGAALVQLLTGPLSDRLGRRAVLLAGVVGFALASAGCALGTAFGVFLVARVAQGCAGVWALNAGYAAIHELFESRTAIRIQAWISGITLLAPALGPALGALLMAAARWQAMFLLLAACAAALFAPLRKWTPESVDFAGRLPLTTRRVAADYLHLLRNLPLMCLLAVWCLVFAVTMVWTVAGPFMLRDADGGSRGFVWAQAYACGSFVVGTRLVDRLLRLYPRALLLGWALDGCLGGICLTLLAALLRAPAALVVALFGVFMAGAGLLLSPLYRAVLERARQQMGLRVAWVSCTINLSGALACALAAALELAELRSFAAISLLALLAASALARSRRGLHAEPQPDALRRG